MLEFYRALDAKQKARLAKRLDTSVPYLSHIAHGHRRAGPGLAKRIERATKKQVTRKALRPDIWG
jgi:DNA-binding transcriptional regulator YdaS (Cro superfamily)